MDGMSEQYQDEDFSTYMARERERLASLKRALHDRVGEYQAQLAEVDRELVAIDAYEKAKTGKQMQSKNARTRQRRADLSDNVLQVIQGWYSGGRRVDIINALGLKGDKPGEMAVSNALTRLKNQGRITRCEDKHWVISEPLQRAAE
jgi:hypothetical protein